ncbi:UNVERIFIED_CONTAM: hypothetical protein Sradi_7286200 [Sesamum radiatum]|uniref:Uncharacterized protein n=1 Tax=Sesamum radiatum TaxID=300843 RepID=A0AAW2IJA1_SESRA
MGWRKLVRLRDSLRPSILYRVGMVLPSLFGMTPGMNGAPYSSLPSGPRHTAIPARLSCARLSPKASGIGPPSWIWSMDITHSLPTIHEGRDRIIWTGPGGCFSSAAAYAIYAPPFPKAAVYPLAGHPPPSLHLRQTLVAAHGNHLCSMSGRSTGDTRAPCSSLAHLLQHVFRPSGAPFSFPGQFVTGHRRSVGRTEMARQACGKCLVQGFVGFPCLSSLA